jgi:hypothetical protein
LRNSRERTRLKEIGFGRSRTERLHRREQSRAAAGPHMSSKITAGLTLEVGRLLHQIGSSEDGGVSVHGLSGRRVGANWLSSLMTTICGCRTEQ